MRLLVTAVCLVLVQCTRSSSAKDAAFEHVAVSPPMVNRPVAVINNLRDVVTKSTTPTRWIQEMVNSHNYYRRLHNVQPLRINKTLCEISQAWANHQARTKTWQHNQAVTRKYSVGENLAKYSQFGKAREINGSESVTLWYNEIKDYNFRTGKSKNGYAVGHFTQVVWKASESMGAAMAVRKEGKNNFVYVVANYYPRGNDGQYQRNVPPPARRKVRPHAALDELGSGSGDMEPLPGAKDLQEGGATIQQYYDDEGDLDTTVFVFQDED